MNRKLSVLGCTIAAIATISCNDSVGVGFTDQIRLAKNLATWKSVNAHNYVFHISRSCFCVFGSGEVTVQVEADTVKSVTLVSTGAAMGKEYGTTIDALFETIKNSLPNGRTSATYDSKLGYPKTIVIDCPANVADCGYRATASQLVISP